MADVVVVQAVLAKKLKENIFLSERTLFLSQLQRLSHFMRFLKGFQRSMGIEQKVLLSHYFARRMAANPCLHVMKNDLFDQKTCPYMTNKISSIDRIIFTYLELLWLFNFSSSLR